MIVFDVNNKESFKSCAKWYQDVKDASPNHNIPGALGQSHTGATWSDYTDRAGCAPQVS